jgi:hypothetical protein
MLIMKEMNKRENIIRMIKFWLFIVDLVLVLFLANARNLRCNMREKDQAYYLEIQRSAVMRFLGINSFLKFVAYLIYYAITP